MVIDVVAEAEAEAGVVVGTDRGAVPEADVLGEDEADFAIPLPRAGAPTAAGDFSPFTPRLRYGVARESKDVPGY